MPSQRDNGVFRPEVKDIVYVDTDRLLLDKENPRLASKEAGDSQFELAKILWSEMAVDELVLSISANGFFSEEPLFVIPEHNNASSDGDKFVVIEGNRRLAAVQILKNDEWRKRLNIKEVPELSEAVLQSLERLPVSIYERREDLWAYLGFRHINSPMPWDAFSKSKYVALVHDEYGIPLGEIAKRIGDRHSTVERFYRGYKVLREAEAKTDFHTEDRVKGRFYFSHLYTALDYSQFQDFLGINALHFDEENPVDDAHLANLEQMMVWLYGKKSARIQPIVQRQNPDLNLLREVIGTPDSLDALRSGYSLEKAHYISIGDDRRFREALVSAKEELLQANATVITGYDGSQNSYEVIEDISNIVKSLLQTMKQKYNRQTRTRQR